MAFGQFNPLKIILFFSRLGCGVQGKCSLVTQRGRVLQWYTTPTYHIEFSSGSELEVLGVMVRGHLALELIELAQLHLLHEQMELPWEENIC